MKLNRILSLIALLYFVGRVWSISLGSHYDLDRNRTTFRVYTTHAQQVELLVFTSEKGPLAFTKSMHKINSDGLNSSDAYIAKNTYEVFLEGDFRKYFYKFRVFGNSSIDFKTLSARKIAAESEAPAEIFLFHKVSGHLVATSASDYLDPGIPSGIRKEFYQGSNYFELESNEDSFKNYYVEVMGQGRFPERINGFPVMDPYCKRVSSFENRCKVSGANTNLELIESDHKPSFRAGHTIHEVHLKDLTMLLAGVPEEIRGTFRGAAHPATIKMLQEMQVSTIEFLPLHSFDRNAAPPGHINYWGYMTRGFFALHEPYASVEGRAHEEFKQVVEAMHEAGISVIMDVVYNHTSEGDHRGPTVAFKNLARNEYFRMYDTQKGYYLNTTGVGNTCKSESPIMRKLIIDSLLYFSREFRVDGFRFDLGAAIDKTTFEKIREALPQNTLLTAEPWVAEGKAQWGRSELNGIRIGKWNDQFRKAVKGDYSKPGFINGEGNEEHVRILVRGESKDFGGSGSFIFDKPGDTNPQSIINEIEVHDGYTLFDWLQHLRIPATEIDARIRLASTILLTSVNTPIIHLGQEFGRSKQGDKNSYDKDSNINYIDWSYKNKNRSLANFVNGLKKIRLYYDAFHFSNRIDDDQLVFLDDLQASPNAFGYQLKGARETFLVLLNGASDTGTDFHLPPGIWDVISNGTQVSPRGLGKVTNRHYYLHPTSSAILFKRKL